MKLLWLPLETSPLFHQNGPTKAWKKIFGDSNVVTFNFIMKSRERGVNKMNNELVSVARDSKPDMMFMQLQETNNVYLETIARIKEENPNLIIVNWCGDYRPYLIQGYLNLSKIIDLTLMSNKGQLQMYRDAGAKRMEYMQIGVDCDIYKPLNIPKQKKIIFGGNRSSDFPASKERVELISKFRSVFGDMVNGRQFGFEVYGQGWGGFAKRPVYHEEYNRALNSAQISLGINQINTLDCYFSERHLMMMGSGTMHLGHYVPGLESYFINRYHCVWYHNIDEAVQLAKLYLSNPDACNTIGQYGAKEIQKSHTWECRYREVVDIVESIRKERGIK